MEYCNDNNVRELLESYFAGETSIEQERALSDYFAAADLPADLRYAQAIFSRHRTAASARTEMAVRMPHRNIGRRLVISLSGIAAAAVVALGVWTTIHQDRQTIYCYVNGIAVNDLEDARTITREIFGKVDESLVKLDSSMDAFDNANRSAEKVEKVISMMTIK